VARLFGRGKGGDKAPDEGPGSQTGRAPSGMIITSGLGDWVPPEVEESPGRSENEDAPIAADWLPPGMPEPTSGSAGPERRRSTVNEIPPQLRVVQPPGTELAQPPSPERELKKTLAEVRRELELTREETARLRARIGRLEGPAAPAAEPEARLSEVQADDAPGELRVNLNTANVDELMALPGLGRRAAERIVEYRESRGPFKSVSGLLAVEGFHHDRIRRFGTRAVV
jgi:competence protein ComEA